MKTNPIHYSSTPMCGLNRLYRFASTEEWAKVTCRGCLRHKPAGNQFTDFDDWMDAAETRGYKIRPILNHHWIARDMRGAEMGRFQDDAGHLN